MDPLFNCHFQVPKLHELVRGISEVKPYVTRRLYHSQIKIKSKLQKYWESMYCLQKTIQKILRRNTSYWFQRHFNSMLHPSPCSQLHVYIDYTVPIAHGKIRGRGEGGSKVFNISLYSAFCTVSYLISYTGSTEETPPPTSGMFSPDLGSELFHPGSRIHYPGS